MMQVRCQHCAWLFTLSQEATARAVAEALARRAEQHTFNCPQCGQAISLQVSEMQQRLPADYPLPEVSVEPQTPAAPGPEAMSFSAAGAPASAKGLLSPLPHVDLEQVKEILSTNIAVTPTWDPQRKRMATQTAYRIVAALVAAAWGATLVWLFAQPIQDASAEPLRVGVDLAVVLAPVLAAAAGVERFLETIFGVIEQNWRTLVAYLGHGLRWLHNAESEVQKARKWLAEVSLAAKAIMEQNEITPEQFQALVPNQLDRGKTLQEWQAMAQQRLDTAQNLMGMAEKRLADAERNLSDLTNSPNYKNAKRAASIVLGLWLGLIVAVIGQLQMFALLGVGLVPAQIDVLITGLVIGSGSYPVHSLVGLLQQAKDTLEGAQGYLKTKSAEIRQLAGK